jgi:hypothetical protein
MTHLQLHQNTQLGVLGTGCRPELALARQAKAVIEGKPRKETIEVLRKANRMATGQMMRGRYSKI